MNEFVISAFSYINGNKRLQDTIQCIAELTNFALELVAKGNTVSVLFCRLH